MRVVEIGDNLRVPFRWLVATAVFFMVTVPGGVVWLTVMHYETAQAKANISDLQADVISNAKSDTERDRQYLEILHRMDRRLYRIEILLGAKPGKEE